mmetsp:Transcript_40965/g.47091  ORF Transcript_40965/g.47091 Transcript_40965/m.47091 type:complete len:84 (+) Transcript_40965:570-821(+)
MVFPNISGYKSVLREISIPFDRLQVNTALIDQLSRSSVKPNKNGLKFFRIDVDCKSIKPKKYNLEDCVRYLTTSFPEATEIVL